jgi:hypothetical protein
MVPEPMGNRQHPTNRPIVKNILKSFLKIQNTQMLISVLPEILLIMKMTCTSNHAET